MKKQLLLTALVLSLGATSAYAADEQMGFMGKIKNWFTHLFHKDKAGATPSALAPATPEAGKPAGEAKPTDAKPADEKMMKKEDIKK